MPEPITIHLDQSQLEEIINAIDKCLTASEHGWKDVWDESLPEFAEGKSLYMNANYCEDESIGKIIVWMRDSNAPIETCMPTIFETSFIGDRQSFIREAIRTWDCHQPSHDVPAEQLKPLTPPVE